MYRLLITVPLLTLFAGCTAPLKFEAEPTPDRPQLNTVSHALAVARLIETTDNCRGCADTPLWADERHLVGKVGFDPILVQEKIRDEIREARRRGKLPNVPKDGQGSSFDLTNSLMVSDSLDGRWTTSPSPGVFLGVSALFWLFSSDGQRNPEDVELSPATKYFKAAWVVPERVPEIAFGPDEPNAVRKNRELYAAKVYVETLAKAAEDLGFTRVGDVRIRWKNDQNGNKYWYRITQPLENEALGCPKILSDEEQSHFHQCRVEMSIWNDFGADQTWYQRSNYQTFPKLLGGDDKSEALITSFGCGLFNDVPLQLGKATKVGDVEEAQFAMQISFVKALQKHLPKHMVVYVPAYPIKSDNTGEDVKHTAQFVMDKKNVWYFNVIVPERAPAKIEPAVAK